MYFKLGIFLALAGCAQTTLRQVASFDKSGLELAREEIPASEAEATKEMIELVKSGYEHYKPKDLKPAHRLIHGKDHGCVRAEFKVNQDLPLKLRHGVLAEAKSYPVWIRVSNGSGTINHDGRPDGRGLAIKLMNVEGPKLGDEVGTQDFLFQSAPNFFAKDAADYVKFMKLAAHPGFKGVGEFLKDTNLKKKAQRVGLKNLTLSAANIKNPLSAEYFSALPQNLGPHAMKMHAGPCANSAKFDAGFFKRFRKDFLKKAMTAHLKEHDACIQISVQLQTDATAMPIEDALVKWSPELSPFIPVAQVHIPKQEFLSEKRQQFCEHVSFNPWHSLPEHRPLGGLMRVRKVVYEHSQAHRHTLNQQASSEPNADDNQE